jgi:hypothetical protein
MTWLGVIAQRLKELHETDKGLSAITLRLC